MSLFLRRNTTYLIITAFVLLLFIHLQHQRANVRIPQFTIPQATVQAFHRLRPDDRYDWVNRKEFFPVNTTFEPVPKPSSWRRLPKIQHSFGRERLEAAQIRLERQSAVRQAFQRCWQSYKSYAWLKDELKPVTASYKSTFGGWAATLVDSLDTLWIMDMREEFEEAVEATMTIDFTNTTARDISLFETNIRYLGGLLSAFDLSGDERLGLKAIELGYVLYAAFDTPNRMPINDWDMQNAAFGHIQASPSSMVSAQIGSLSLEFTRLSQITGDARWHDAVHRINMHLMEQQNATSLPGMWPQRIDPQNLDFATGMHFTLGAEADSLYEYLPKLHALLGGAGPYLDMYNRAMEAAIPSLLFRPMLPDADVLFAGTLLVTSDRTTLNPRLEHLVCFVGGMLALGGRLAKNGTHIELGRKMTDGCVWAYEHTQNGVMPESFSAIPCENTTVCTWDEAKWVEAVVGVHALQPIEAEAIVENYRVPKGFASIDQRSYLLRPEAIESVFILYRSTGDPELLEKGWKMFQSVYELTRTEYANSAVSDVTSGFPIMDDSMESFWTAETLKYFYLLFSETSLIDLDEYVFNTEAHPLKRP